MIATNDELALLEKWKQKLCLQEWRIKLLTHLHPEEMMVRNTAGCTEWLEAIKTARIEIINPACYGDRIVPFNFEKTLVLGSYESVFLKAVKRKADLLGIDCDLTQYPCPPYKAVVVDRETVPSDIKLAAEVDIDHSYSQGMSSVSQATLALLLALDLVHAKDITIVGRGHAVQNLAKYLTLDNATVTVAHSKTKSLLQATMNRDVVIYATPIITKDISYNTHDLVIDLGNSVPHPDRFNCPYVNRIGQLTVSVLLNRFARKEHRA